MLILSWLLFFSCCCGGAHSQIAHLMLTIGTIKGGENIDKTCMQNFNLKKRVKLPIWFFLLPKLFISENVYFMWFSPLLMNPWIASPFTSAWYLELNRWRLSALYCPVSLLKHYKTLRAHVLKDVISSHKIFNISEFHLHNYALEWRVTRSINIFVILICR